VTPCSPPARALTGFGKLGYIVLATIPQTLGGLLVALAGHVLYPAYGSGPQLVGVDALTDQQIAGSEHRAGEQDRGSSRPSGWSS